MGERIHQPPQTKARKSVTATASSSFDVFDTWAQVYDEQPNPLLTLEQQEKLEQLRALENGYRIRVVPSIAPSLEIDTAEDLDKARRSQMGRQ